MRLRSALKRRLVVSDLPVARRDAVLLTFDDGPHPEGTPAVLDVLARFSARAIFFVVGSRVGRAPQLLRRIIDEGHLIGNHSFAHPLDRPLRFREYPQDLEACQAIVESWTGRRPRFFRPPLGQISVGSLVAPRLKGLMPLLWSVDSNDWRLRRSEDVPVTAAALLAALSGRRLHDIVLFHDERVYTAELLERVLPELAARNVDLRPPLGSRGAGLPHR